MEIPVYSDLSGFSDLQHMIINVFSSPTEEVRSAASYALGKTCIVLYYQLYIARYQKSSEL